MTVHGDQDHPNPDAAPPPHPLIDVQALTKLRDESWRVFDCRFDIEDPDWGAQAYRDEHLPGAVYVHLERDLSAEPTGNNGRHPLPSTEELEAVFSRLGVGRGTHVVAYDSSGGPYAARLWWTLRYLGHTHVQVLNGGFPAWKRAGLPTESGVKRVQSAEFAARTQPGMLATLSDVTAALQADDHDLVDARAPERYRGEQEPYDPVAGRIPGARNHYWKRNLGEQGAFLPPSRLRDKLESSLADDREDEIISYCGSGVTAAHNVLAMRAAGLPEPKLYVGSWSEWCAEPERPVERDG